MQIEFIHAYPFEELRPRLHTLFQGARRIDAAIAFVTRYGVDLWLKILHAPEPPDAKLVVSVRFPTDLAALCRLEPRMNGNLFIHTGYHEPHEERADRGQFHSKTVLIEYENGECCIVVGSHNWTEFGLCGVNLEAGVIIRCRSDDDIVAQVRQHIDACAERSERFDPNRLRYYETIQSDLHASPPKPDSVAFEGFERLDALVMHAEDHTTAGPADPMQLFFRVTEVAPDGFFRNGRRIHLFVHPKGSLFGQATPTQPATVFDGEITMQNTVAVVNSLTMLLQLRVMRSELAQYGNQFFYHTSTTLRRKASKSRENRWYDLKRSPKTVT